MIDDSASIQSKRYALLSEARVLVANTPDLELLLEQLTRLARQGLDFDLCLLALMNSDARTYRLQALFDPQGRLPPLAEKTVPAEQGSAGAVMGSQKMHLMTDQRAIQDEIQFLGGSASEEPSLAAVLSHPLVVYGRAFGAVSFATTGPGGYDNEDIQFASSIATQLALAIDRLQQAQQLRRTRQELGSLASFPELNPSAIIEHIQSSKFKRPKPSPRVSVLNMGAFAF